MTSDGEPNTEMNATPPASTGDRSSPVAAGADDVHGRTLIKNSLHSLFNTAFSMATTWIVSIWVARQLGPTNYGIFTLVLWLVGIFSWAIGMGLVHAVTKFVAEYHGRNEPSMIAPIVRFVLRIEVVLALGTTAVLSFLSTPVADFFFSPTESFLFFVAFLGLAPGVVTAVLSSTVEGVQKFEYFTVANLTITPLSLIAKVVVVWKGYGILGLLVSMLAFSILNVVFYLFVLRREKVGLFTNRRKLGPDLVARLKRYNFDVTLVVLCDKIIWDRSENFFLGRFCSAAQTGFYNLGFSIVQRFTSILPSTLWRVLFPAMSGYFGSGDREKTERVFFLATRYLAFLSFPVGAGGAILAYPLLHYLYGHEFVGVQRPLQIIFLASIVTGLCNAGAAVLYGYERQAFIYKLGAIMAAVNIAMDIILIPRHGALGAAICYATTTVIGSSIGTIYTCRTMKLPYPFVSIFKVLFATIIMGTVMEIVILQNRGLGASIFALLAGTLVYLVCALVLGTFEKEDYTLLESVRAAVPGRAANAVGATIRFISQFKSS